MAFRGWPVEAVELYEGLEADSSRSYWLAHKATYDTCVSVSFSAEGLFVGCGLYRPDPPELQRFRAAVADDRAGPELEAILAALRAAGATVGANEVLRTAPKGFDRDHPRIELLRHKGIVASGS
jgi:uncharacterized protein (DUF2461 family)